MGPSIIMLLFWRFVIYCLNPFGFIDTTIQESLGDEYGMCKGDFPDLRWTQGRREALLVLFTMLFVEA
ncbi:uncharacterized protein LOC117899708 [Drosophila subobscura]|uniref:uncharacterized protein LOC117899708 n=1 Tax=Drosophila subobscura TaxID=7241 RepID=UPI00155A934E|nr:uncharacterized protein LOC117899708 [Drosophila subobscura]